MQKKILIYLIPTLIFVNSKVLGQDSISLDVLKAPLSPASVILGINPTDIERPTDVTGLMLSLRNATTDFTSIPPSFAIDIAPKWFFDKKHISFNDFIGNKFKQTFQQSFTVSLAQLSQNDSNYTGLKQAFGIKFSLARGKIFDQHFFDNVKGIRKLISQKHHIVDSVFEQTKLKDTEFKALQIKQDSAIARFEREKVQAKKDIIEQEIINNSTDMEVLERIIQNETKIIVDSIFAEKNKALKKLEETITPVRKGFFLDISAGTILKYNDFTLNKSSLTNNSVWINLGYEGLNTDAEGKSYFSLIAMSRYIGNNADELYKKGINNKNSTWDNGVRIAYTTLNQKLSLSGELITRNFLSSTKNNLSKYLFNVEYKIGKNQKLTFSYGKDFSNNVTKDGTVIGLLNFVKGFFADKKISE